MLGGGPLGRDVLNHVERWVPSQVHGHENAYQSELQEYLDDALNSDGMGGLGMGGGDNHYVSIERGTSYGDVVVDDEVGIELKRNFSNDQQKKLRGQLDDYADNYDFVIACTCGIEDIDGWRELESRFQNRQQGIMDTTQFAFVIKHRENMGGDEDSNGGGGLLGGDGLI